MWFSLALLSLLTDAAALTYTHSNGVDTFDIADCHEGPTGPPSGTAAQIECSNNEAVMAPFQHMIDSCIDAGHAAPQYCCQQQYHICHSIPEYQGNSAECAAHFTGCQRALRHLHKMMFNQSPLETEPQICNNFARKSIRGFFHDFMSNGIDGSILSEHSISMNFGLCRWAQYVNTLSDETQCDPGSIIAMAGMLGYTACGVPIWEQDVAVKPTVHLGRAYSCGQHIDWEMFDEATRQRRDQFSDTQAATNSTAMEEFWYTTNHHFARGDGEIEYSAEAGAAAHAIGRVTCAPDGTDTDGNHIDFSLGFFHVQRDDSLTTNRERYQEALNKIGDTQCDETSGEQRPTAGVRTETDRFPTVAGETNMNPEGGFCGMPTQFLGTVRVGGQHRVPRWISNTENMLQNRDTGVTPSLQLNPRQLCNEQLLMYIPHELLTIGDVALPESEALQRFVAIAWDGYDRIDSEWDGCEVGCDIPILENSLCGGSGLSSYDWTLGFCDSGISNGGHVCCDSSCGVCDDAADCAARDGGSAACCAVTIEAEGRACRSSWDVACMIPRRGDGGVCTTNDDCSSASCKTGRCCNAYGQSEGTVACDLSGNALTCGDGFVRRGIECVSACECSPGCEDCSCGTCNSCSDAHYLTDGVCHPKSTAGQECSDDEQCSTGRCAGGNCCDTNRLADGCVDCNFRGLCAECGEGYTLCGHSDDGNGQCTPAWSSTTTTFACGTGGPGTDFPSPDGYNYCAQAQVCPCTSGGCYKTCEISYDCWLAAFDYIEYVDATMFRRNDPWVGEEHRAYEPPEFSGITAPVASDCEGSWGDWGECSEACGGGSRTRPYIVTAASQFGGQPCPEPMMQTCNLQDCEAADTNANDEEQSGPTPSPGPPPVEEEDTGLEQEQEQGEVSPPESTPVDADDETAAGDSEEEELIEVAATVLSADQLAAAATTIAGALSSAAASPATAVSTVAIRSSMTFPVALDDIAEGSAERAQFEQDFKAAMARTLGGGEAVQPEQIVITAISSARRRMEAVDCPHMRMLRPDSTQPVAKNPHRQLQEAGAVTVAFELITPSSVMQEAADLFVTLQQSTTPISIEVGGVSRSVVPSGAMTAPTVVRVAAVGTDPELEEAKASGGTVGAMCHLGLLMATLGAAIEAHSAESIDELRVAEVWQVCAQVARDIASENSCATGGGGR